MDIADQQPIEYPQPGNECPGLTLGPKLTKPKQCLSEQCLFAG